MRNLQAAPHLLLEMEVTAETEIPEKYVVQSGDSLWKITSNLYNNELSDNEISEKIANRN